MPFSRSVLGVCLCLDLDVCKRLLIRRATGREAVSRHRPIVSGFVPTQASGCRICDDVGNMVDVDGMHEARGTRRPRACRLQAVYVRFYLLDSVDQLLARRLSLLYLSCRLRPRLEHVVDLSIARRGTADACRVERNKPFLRGRRRPK